MTKTGKMRRIAVLAVLALTAVVLVIAPRAASAGTITETFTITLPQNAGLALPSSDIPQFDPTLGNLTEVQMSLTGQVVTFADPDDSALSNETVMPTLDGLEGFSSSQTFGGPGNPPLGTNTLNLSGTSTNPTVLGVWTGTGNKQVFLTFGPEDPDDLPAAPDITVASVDGTLSGTFTFDFTPPVAATPLPAALPLFATGIGGLGLLGWRRKRKVRAVA
jgi:hypothetical protein